ncbi:MAG: hypothetical protein ABEK01_01625 [Candidatus Nanohaloarchaea archaeon]
MMLEARDKKLFLVGIILSLIAGAAAQLGYLGLRHELLAGYLPGVTIPFAIYFAYRARDIWGGQITRYLEIIIAGLVAQFVIYIPHLYWHFQAIGPKASLPAWGASTNFWYVFFHGLSAYSFLLIAYGFYRFWKSA